MLEAIEAVKNPILKSKLDSFFEKIPLQAIRPELQANLRVALEIIKQSERFQADLREKKLARTRSDKRNSENF